MVIAMTPDEFMNEALPWIFAVAVVVWVAVMLFRIIFGRDDD
jgi:hypothetical protein